MFAAIRELLCHTAIYRHRCTCQCLPLFLSVSLLFLLPLPLRERFSVHLSKSRPFSPQLKENGDNFYFTFSSGRRPLTIFILSAVCQVRVMTSPTRPMACESEDIMLMAPTSCSTSSAEMVSARIRDSAKQTSSDRLLGSKVIYRP